MADQAAESKPESREIDLYYRELLPADWPLALPMLSASFPGRSITLDPETQRVAAAITASGMIVALAIVSAAYHMAYIDSADNADDLARLDILQSVAESFLPPKTVYYSMVQTDPEGRTLTDALSMEHYPDVSVYVKRTADPTDLEDSAAGS